MNSGKVPEELVQRWEAVYGEYIAADRLQRTAPDYSARMARVSAAVATAWRDLAATSGLLWWLLASLTTSAEAFDRQAARDQWRARSGRPVEQ